MFIAKGSLNPTLMRAHAHSGSGLGLRRFTPGRHPNASRKLSNMIGPPVNERRFNWVKKVFLKIRLSPVQSSSTKSRFGTWLGTFPWLCRCTSPPRYCSIDRARWAAFAGELNKYSVSVSPVSIAGAALAVSDLSGWASNPRRSRWDFIF
jgi:hypothetical protein